MLKGILKREISKQFLRFCLVGLESTILTYLIYITFFNFLSFKYVYAYIISVILGTLFGFYFNKSFSFESKEKLQRSFLVYFMVYAFSLSLGGFLLKFLINNGGLAPIIAIIPVLVFTTVVNFFGAKIFAFKNKKW